jgi:predicted nucleotidyltransferase
VLNKLFKKISTALNKNKIPYMIIGGQAALLYREPRFTNDIDITIGLGIDDADKILQICNEIKLKVLIENTNEFLSQTMVLPVLDEISDFRIDFIFSGTQFEKEAISRVNIVDIDGCEVSFCSLEDLIILKLFAGRPRDIDDVRTIIRKNPRFDREFVINNLVELGKAIDIDLVESLINMEKY